MPLSNIKRPNGPTKRRAGRWPVASRDSQRVDCAKCGFSSRRVGRIRAQRSLATWPASASRPEVASALKADSTDEPMFPVYRKIGRQMSDASEIDKKPDFQVGPGGNAPTKHPGSDERRNSISRLAVRAVCPWRTSAVAGNRGHGDAGLRRPASMAPGSNSPVTCSRRSTASTASYVAWA